MPDVKIENEDDDDLYERSDGDDEDDDDDDDGHDGDESQLMNNSGMVFGIASNSGSSSSVSLSVATSLSSGTNVNMLKVPIMKDGMAICIRCGNVGVKDTFYGKGKQFCSASCVKGISVANQSVNISNLNQQKTPLFKLNTTPSTSTTLNTVTLPLTPANAAALKKVTSLTGLTPGTIKLTQTTPATCVSNKTQIVSITYKESSPKPVQGNFKKPASVTPTINNVLTPNRANKIIASTPIKGSAKHLMNSYDWTTVLANNCELNVAPVSSFKHAPMSDLWDSLVTIGLKVEVRNKDFPLSTPSKLVQDVYWIASVVKISGYFVLLRYEGFCNDPNKDFWVNIFTTQVHPVGWCASQGKVLIPPKSIEEKYSDWKGFLVKRLTGSRTLPENFYEQLKESLKSRFQVGMRLEVVDKKRISAVRVATIDKIIGGRLHVSYEGADETDSGFICHQQSSLIHPVGWAQVVGHELRATPEYAKSSLEKCLNKKFDENDSKWSMFPPVASIPQSNNSEHKFREGMKLEAIDPLNLSTICVATVTKVLRQNYLMIGIDGMMAVDGSDWFCYHATSPCIFPVGFCMLNKLPLTAPRGYNKEFNWYNYLKETKSIAAPVPLFKKDIPNHGFKEGMFVEAVDLMEPRLVCVATIARVVGRLLRIHFNGWDESYDQWVDCETPELFPSGWCQLVGYPLEAPRDEEFNSSGLSSSLGSPNDPTRRKRNTYKGRYKRKKRGGYHGSISPNGSNGHQGDILVSDDNGQDNITSFNSIVSEWTSSKSSSSSPTSPSPLVSSFSSCDAITSNSSVVVKPSPIQPLFVPEKMSGKLASDPRSWSIMDVAQFLRVNDCGAYCQAFCSRKIDGEKLINLTSEDIMELANMKVGPSLKIHALIQSLKDGKK